MLILQISAGLMIICAALAFVSNEFAFALSRSLEAALEWVEYKLALYEKRRAETGSLFALRGGVNNGIGNDDHIVGAQVVR
ncbi:MAG: hypothetical protein MSG64_08800 [Pyrinomonadaceae bacterium MAG19_C2-C3]|nr:hypothetical protein [Pyrinomonadaceae bacterium MAG19_C2-C3]